MINTIIKGHALTELPKLPTESVNCCICSPPYWGLRDYGIEPVIWDGDKEFYSESLKRYIPRDCKHEFNEYDSKLLHENRQNLDGGTLGNPEYRENLHGFGNSKAGFCAKCGAWKGSLGLEPDFDLYIKHLCDIFDEVKRVLRKDGTCWVNIGDSYWGSGQGGADYGGKEIIPSSNFGHIAKGKNYPNKSLCDIPYRFSIEMINRGWIKRNTIIWHKPNCLNGGTVLYAKTQRGVMPSTLKDLVRLKPSTVKLWDGENWQQVKEWNKNPNPQDIKDITFRNDEVIKCTGEHLFPLLNNDIKKANELKVGDIIKNTSLPSEIKDIGYIPDEIGWLIGTYLADGSIGDKGRCLQYSSNINEQDRFNQLKKIAEKYDARCYSFNDEGNSTTFNIYSKILIAIIKTYIGGKSAKDKHLTNNVWQRNNAFLDNILKGYLSGDGHYEKENNRYRLGFTRNEYLARDLRLLCARLGYYIKLQKGIVFLKDKIFKKYSGEIRLIISNHFNIKSGYEIINIKKGKKIGYFWDIVLEKEPHIFASHSGLLIHNCMPASANDRFTVDFEYLFFFTKNNKTLFWTNEKTLECISKNPSGTKGIEGKDWEWRECPNCQGEGTIIGEALKEGAAPRLMKGIGIVTKNTKAFKVCPRCKGSGKIKYSFWTGHDYWFEQQFEKYAPSTLPRMDRGVNFNKWTLGADGQTPHNLSQPRLRKERGYKTKQMDKEIHRQQHHGKDINYGRYGRNKRCVWKIPTKSFKEAHFAVFPETLVEPIIQAGCPEFICKKCGKARVKIYDNQIDFGIEESDTKYKGLNAGSLAQKRQAYRKLGYESPPRPKEIGYSDCGCNAGWESGINLDPFMGAGTSALVALKQRKRFIGIEIKQEYIDMSYKRIAKVQQEIF